MKKKWFSTLLCLRWNSYTFMPDYTGKRRQARERRWISERHTKMKNVVVSAIRWAGQGRRVFFCCMYSCNLSPQKIPRKLVAWKKGKKHKKNAISEVKTRGTQLLYSHKSASNCKSARLEKNKWTKHRRPIFVHLHAYIVRAVAFSIMDFPLLMVLVAEISSVQAIKKRVKVDEKADCYYLTSLGEYVIFLCSPESLRQHCEPQLATTLQQGLKLCVTLWTLTRDVA